MDLCRANTCRTFAVAAKTAFQLKRILCTQKLACAMSTENYLNAEQTIRTDKNQVNYMASLSFSSMLQLCGCVRVLDHHHPPPPPLPFSCVLRATPKIFSFADLCQFFCLVFVSCFHCFFSFLASLSYYCALLHTCMQFRLLRFFTLETLHSFVMCLYPPLIQC